jgi:ankyrin repeat protein
MSENALIDACIKGDFDEVKNILAIPGININHKDSDCSTALICACQSRKADIANHLLTIPGIDINHKGWEGWTALMIACGNVSLLSVAKTILTMPDIDLKATNKHGWTAFMYTRRFNNYAAMRLVFARELADIRFPLPNDIITTIVGYVY